MTPGNMLDPHSEPAREIVSLWWWMLAAAVLVFAGTVGFMMIAVLTFDPAQGAKVLFGPAGRPLPQLPLGVRADGTLEATDGFNGDVGPAWSGIDRGDDA